MRVYDPPKSRAWKRKVAGYYLEAVSKAGCKMPVFPTGPIHLSVICFFPLPKQSIRKANPPQARYDDKHHGDLTNLVKGLEDAGNGILWRDDCQLSSLTASKWIAAQGQEPHTRVQVRTINTDFRLPPQGDQE